MARTDIIIAGYSSFSWALVSELDHAWRGRVYYVLPDRDQAVQASLRDNVTAIEGEITNVEVLGSLDFDTCAVFVAGGRKDEDNVMAALYAYHQCVPKVYARVFEPRLIPLVSSLGVIPLQTSHVAAAFITLRLLKPAVAQLVALSSEGRFGLVEVHASDYPELVGCRLGNLHADQLHIVAVAHGEDISLGYNTVITADSRLIVIYDRHVEQNLRAKLREVAQQAAKYFRQAGQG